MFAALDADDVARAVHELAADLRSGLWDERHPSGDQGLPDIAWRPRVLPLLVPKRQVARCAPMMGPHM